MANGLRRSHAQQKGGQVVGREVVLTSAQTHMQTNAFGHPVGSTAAMKPPTASAEDDKTAVAEAACRPTADRTHEHQKKTVSV